MDFRARIKSVLTEPTVFFSRLKKEQGIKTAFKYLAFIALVSVVLGFVIALLIKPSIPSYMTKLLGEEGVKKAQLLLEQQSTPGALFKRAIFGYIGALVGTFVWAALLHVWILIWGGRAPYTKTYQMSVYSSTPNYLFSWIPYIGGFAWIYGFILLILGTQRIHGLSKTRTMVMYVIPLVVFLILALLLFGFIFFLMSSPNGFPSGGLPSP